MAYHGGPSAEDAALVAASLGEATRAVVYHEDRARALKDRRAQMFVLGAEKKVTVEAMAAAAGVSVALVKAELTRARKMPVPQEVP